MARPVTGKIMEDKVWVRQKNGTYYCYLRKRIWKDGKTVGLGKTLLGKSDEKDGELRPTREKRQPQNKSAGGGGLLKASRKHTGMMDIIDFIGRDSGVDEDLKAASDGATAQKLLSLARYIVGTAGDSFPGIEEWMLTHPLPYAHPITEDVYRKLLDETGRDEAMRQNYFRNRFAREDKMALVIAYDGSTQNAMTANPEARPCENKEHNGKRAVKILVLYSLETRQPLAYFKQPGNVPDIISVSCAIEEAKAIGVSGDILLVTDNGFSSEENLASIVRSGNHFLTKVKRNWKWVREQVDSHLEELGEASSVMPSDTLVKGISVPLTKEFRYKRAYGSTAKDLKAGETDKFRKRVYLYIYYDSARKEKDDRDFMEELLEIKNSIEKGLDLAADAEAKAGKYLSVKEGEGGRTATLLNGRINAACKYNGVFVLVSDRKRTADEALQIYRKREWIEDYFERFKQYADGSTSRTGDPGNLQGRMFVQFVAMGYIEHMHEKIRRIKAALGNASGDPVHDTDENLGKERKLKNWLEKRSMHRILTWFDAYETVEVSSDITSRRWSTATIERDRLLLEKLGMKENN